MKIECEIPDINRDEIIERMAVRLLGFDYHRDPEDPDPTPEIAKWDSKAIGKHLRVYFESKVAELAEQAVRRCFDDAIRSRIDAAVDVVLAEGWRETNNYGEQTGAKLDLKGRISKLLQEARGDNYNRKASVLDERVELATKELIAAEFKPLIEQARATLKSKLDTSVMNTVAETIKASLGLR